MQTLLYTAAICEMLLVNLMTVHLCVQKKYSNFIVVLVLLACSLIVVPGGLMLINHISGSSNGNGIFMPLGFIYLIPLKFLYRETIDRIFVIMCSTWIYTILVFSISMHIGQLIDPSMFSGPALAIQTVIYLFSAPLFMRFVRRKFVYILQNIPASTTPYLRYGSLMWFATVVIVNMAFIQYESGYLKPAALIFLAINALLNYSLLYVVVKTIKDVEHLQEIVYIDSLTGLKNRSSFMMDAQGMIDRKEPFSLIYMDLDCFKSINDHLGHLAGDEYIVAFTEEISGLMGEFGCLYRLYGDEFVCIYPENAADSLAKRIMSLRGVKFSGEYCFLGVSIGCVSFPNDARDLSHLIALADERMYHNKRTKR